MPLEVDIQIVAEAKAKLKLPKGGKWVKVKSGPAKGKAIYIKNKKIVAPAGAAAAQGMQDLPDDGLEYRRIKAEVEDAIDEAISASGVGDSEDYEMDKVFDELGKSGWGSKMNPRELEHFTDKIRGSAKSGMSGWYNGTDSMGSQYLQNSVRQVFGITSKATNAGDRKGRSDALELGKEDVLAARVIYKATQAYFKKRGITEVTVYRGTAKSAGAPTTNVLGNGRVNLSLRPLNSFSSEPGTAHTFAKDTAAFEKTPIFLKSKVPVKQVFMTRNSMSRKAREIYYGEGEVTVLGTRKTYANTRFWSEKTNTWSIGSFYTSEAVEKKPWLWVDLEEMNDYKDWRQEYRRLKRRSKEVAEAKAKVKLPKGGRWVTAKSGPARGKPLYIVGKKIAAPAASQAAQDIMAGKDPVKDFADKAFNINMKGALEDSTYGPGTTAYEEGTGDLNNFFGKGKVSIEELTQAYSTDSLAFHPSLIKNIGGERGYIAVLGVLKTESGKTVGRVERNISKTSANHVYFQLDKAYTGKGGGKQILAKSVTLYEKIGVKKVHLNANINVGGYAWAKYGFDFASRDVQRARKGLSGRVGRHLKKAGAPAKERLLIVNTLKKNGNSWDFANLKYKGQPIGKKALLGSDWDGTLTLNPKSNGRKIFNAYVTGGRVSEEFSYIDGGRENDEGMHDDADDPLIDEVIMMIQYAEGKVLFARDAGIVKGKVVSEAKAKAKLPKGGKWVTAKSGPRRGRPIYLVKKAGREGIAAPSGAAHIDAVQSMPETGLDYIPADAEQEGAVDTGIEGKQVTAGGGLPVHVDEAKPKLPKGGRWVTMRGRHVLVIGKGKSAKPVGGTAPPGMEVAAPLSLVTDAKSAFEFLADAGVVQGGEYGSVDLTSFKSAEDMQKAVGAIADEHGRIRESGFSALNGSLDKSPVRYMGFENASTFKKGPAAEEAKFASGTYTKEFDRIDLAYGKSKQWDERGPVGIGGANVDFSAKGIYRHELGHHVYKTMHGPGRRELITTLRDEVVKNPKNVVSKYAKTSPEEAFSEAFSAFTHPNYATERRKLPSNVETKMKAFLKGQ